MLEFYSCLKVAQNLRRDVAIWAFEHDFPIALYAYVLSKTYPWQVIRDFQLVSNGGCDICCRVALQSNINVTSWLVDHNYFWVF